MRNALAVHLSDGLGPGANHRTVTAHASDVRFATQAPGGFFDASFKLDLPPGDLPWLAGGNRCFLTDKRTGRVVWDGYVRAPTPLDGTSYDISCVGGSVVASDQSRALAYIDSSYEKWNQSRASSNAVASGSAETTDDPVDDTDPTDMGTVLKCQLNPASPVGPGKWAGAAYNALNQIGMEVGALAVTIRSGLQDTGYQAELYASPSGTLLPLGTNGGITTNVVAATRAVGDHYPAGTRALLLRIRRTGGATNVALDTIWSAFGRLSLVTRRMDRYGTLAANYTALGSATSVRADQVVEDLLGRVLTMCDPTTAVVDPGTALIDQLTYYDGVKPSVLLDDLTTLYEPDMLWEVLQTLPNGLHAVAFRVWPTTPRYLLGSDVDIELQGSDVDLANRILITWTDERGNQVTRAFGQEVASLGAGSPVNADGTPNTAFTGRVVDADPVTLPDGKGSLANATRIATQILTAVAGGTPLARKATVGGRVYDRLRNLFVEAHELQSGYLARDVEAGEDLRVTNVDYTDADGAATLDLGVPTLTIDQRFAQLTKTVSGIAA